MSKEVYKYQIQGTPLTQDERARKRLEEFGSVYQIREEKTDLNNVYVDKKQIGSFIIRKSLSKGAEDVVFYSTMDLGDEVTCFYELRQKEASWWLSGYYTDTVVMDLLVGAQGALPDTYATFGTAHKVSLKTNIKEKAVNDNECR